MRSIVYVQPDGTAAVVAPIPGGGETEADTLARVAGALGLADWDAVRPEVVAALRRADAPVPGSVVTRAELVRRIYPLTIALAVATGDQADALRAKWDRLLAPVSNFETIHLTDPTLAALIALARSDGLVTAEAAAAVTATGVG